MKEVFSSNEREDVPVFKAENGQKENIDEEEKREYSYPLFHAPLKTLVVTSRFGIRNDPFSGKEKIHNGTDYRTGREGVYAMLSGRVKRTGKTGRLGKFVVLEHGDYEVTYGHLSMALVEKGDSVQAGFVVGISGNTGRSTGPHLHVSIRYKGKLVDPHPLVEHISRLASEGYVPNPDAIY